MSDPMVQRSVEEVVADYLAAWNEAAVTARRALLERVWHEEGNYVDPLAQAGNRTELDRLIARFHAENPGARFTQEGKVDHHHGHVRFFWTLHLAHGAEVAGMDYGEVGAEGRLTKIVGFF